MSRPQRTRLICSLPKIGLYGPLGKEASGSEMLTLDEFEVLRCIDHEGLTHEQCAAHMGISRTTVTELIERARYKLMDALLEGKSLEISGGSYHLCDENGRKACGGICTAMRPSSRRTEDHE